MLVAAADWRVEALGKLHRFGNRAADATPAPFRITGNSASDSIFAAASTASMP